MRIRYLKDTPAILNASPLVLLQQDDDPSVYQGVWREQFLSVSPSESLEAEQEPSSESPKAAQVSSSRIAEERPKAPFKKRLELEIGCGRGRFLSDMATLHPLTYFIGNELVPTILARTSKRIETSPAPVHNVRLIQIDALKLTEVFAPGEVDRIYLNFSDPWPKTKHHKRRLTSPDFLKVYAAILSPQGDLCFKTDNDDLFAFSIEMMQEEGWVFLDRTDDLHHSKYRGANVMTEYEENFMRRGKTIHYVRAMHP